MALWIGRNEGCFTIHTKKPKWEENECTIPDCTSCSGYADAILDLCYEDAVLILPALKKLKVKDVTKFSVKIGG